MTTKTIISSNLDILLRVLGVLGEGRYWVRGMTSEFHLNGVDKKKTLQFRVSIYQITLKERERDLHDILISGVNEK